MSTDKPVGGKLVMMNRSGDTLLAEWAGAADTAGIKAANRQLREARGQGYLAYNPRTREQVHEITGNEEQVILSPAYQGG